MVNQDQRVIPANKEHQAMRASKGQGVQLVHWDQPDLLDLQVKQDLKVSKDKLEPQEIVEMLETRVPLEQMDSLDQQDK